jgi:acyl-CoA synthetase (AMP-forming)/AMP-acid ligase II
MMDDITEPMTYPFLLEKLTSHAKATPEKIALNFLGCGEGGGVVERSYSYGQIERQTTELACTLLRSSLSKGDLVVLVYPPSLDFCIAFLACFKAGVIAVPVFPPNPARKESLDVFSKIVAETGAKFALTSKQYKHMKLLASVQDSLKGRFKSSSAAWPEITWIVTDSTSAPNSTSSSKTTTTSSASSDLAFLQYTSGSTSDPKGVMITHGNLAHNLYIITRELKASTDTVVVSWLPQYHDMGLIGSYLGILYCGGTGYYMSPLTFLQRPMIWIEAASKFHATHLQAPNFAFKLCARKRSEHKAKLDLSSIQHIINGAEPVDEGSIQAFCKAFSPYGLKRDVIYPTYGLAEHTVFVCSGGAQIVTVDKEKLEIEGAVIEVLENQSSDAVRCVVGCGYPSKQNVDVRIVNSETCKELDQNVVGEIWVSSPSKALGYFNKPLETDAVFHAHIVTPTDGVSDNEYLRTGDLGFLHNKELFICGRLKDLIIIGGRNYFPQDIEATAEAASTLLRPGCSAAFSVTPSNDGSEEVALIVELRDVPPPQDIDAVCNSLIQKVQAAIKQEHSLQISHFVLLKPRTIPKTTSGKIARSWCRKAYLSKTLQSVFWKDLKIAQSSPDEFGFPMDNGNSTHPFEIDAPKSVHAANEQVIREMTLSEIRRRLMNDISKLGHLSDPVDFTVPLISLMDSLSISQFKGMLEVQYFTKLSDDYLFRESTTLGKLVEVVKHGFAPDDVTDHVDSQNRQGNPAATPSSAAGRAQGLAGVLGCPPGVICTIL